MGDRMMQSVDANSGEDVDLSVLEDVGVAFDPSNQTVDLTKDEKRRTTALMMAINYHVQTIVKDAAMYRELVHNNQHLSPTTCRSVVSIATEFDRFIAGRHEETDPVDHARQQSDQPSEA